MDIEVFDGNLLYYTYSRSVFREALEKIIVNSQEELTQLINLTRGEVKELVKSLILDRPEYSFANAMRLLANVIWSDNSGNSENFKK